MKFPLIHTGRRFFFFTFVVEGRRAVLSRLERGARRPALLPAGERVAAVWRALHKIEPHFTASDFVIMPDHVHLLLIVNSEGEFRFNPLVFAHWFLRATGALPPEPPRVRRGTPPNPRQSTGGWGLLARPCERRGTPSNPRSPRRAAGRHISAGVRGRCPRRSLRATGGVVPRIHCGPAISGWISPSIRGSLLQCGATSR